MANSDGKGAGDVEKQEPPAQPSDPAGKAAPESAGGGDTVNKSGSGRTELPAQFGRYRVKQKLGGGGMGTVELVENTELEREEALKVPHFADGDNPQVRERFLREAKSAAKLEHAYLCPVYDAGVQDGIYYLTMRYLDGKLLSDFAGRAQPARKAVEIVAKLAQALEAAHGKGVIHRDLKPSNVMMVTGVGPVVMDFGLAKQIRQADQQLTQQGSSLGTPAYMPPEQVRGDLEQMGPASDVYSLGVILYELLTGRLPFEGSMAAVFGQILYTEAPLPSTLVPGLSPALDVICRKAMAKAPADRYASMKAFAAALLDYLRSAPAPAGVDKREVFEIPPAASPPQSVDKAAIFQAATVAPGERPAGTAPAPRPVAAAVPKRKSPTPVGPSAAGAKKKPAPWLWVGGLSALVVLSCVGLWAAGVFRSKTPPPPPEPGPDPVHMAEPDLGDGVDGERPDVGRPHVVIVGIDRYADPRIKPRLHAEADARAFYDLFTSKAYLGVDARDVRLLLGSADAQRHSRLASRDNILKALHWVVEDTHRKDLVIFAFFGQGAPQGQRTCYFAADSTFQGRAANAVSASEIEAEFKDLKSQRACVFLDVNFNGFSAAKGTAPDVNLNNFYTEFTSGDDDRDAGAGRALFLATDGLKPGLELQYHSAFAQVLLDGLKGAADTEGYEPDGVVTVAELVKHFGKRLPALIRQQARSKEEREAMPEVFGPRASRIELTKNPSAWRVAQKRLEKFSQLRRDGRLTPEVCDEGTNFLRHMPKLEAQQSLRKDYQKLVDGTMTVAVLMADRERILESVKLDRLDAVKYASKVLAAIKILQGKTFSSTAYIKEINEGEMVGWAVHGLYRRLDETMPKDIKDRLDRIKELPEADLAILLADVRERLGKREDLDKHKDLDYTLQTMLSHLDAHTTYVDPEMLAQFKSQTSSNFAGVGVQIRKDLVRDMLVVATPLKDSPAYKAGMQTGDIITTIIRDVDSEGNALPRMEVTSTKGLPLNDAVKKMKGQAGTPIKLIIEREGVRNPITFELKRGTVKVESVLGTKRKRDNSWDYVIDPENRIAYVRLTNFAAGTADDLKAIVTQLERQGIKGFILDLRFNLGGLLQSAIDISDLFIDDGVIVSVRPRVGRGETYPATNGGKHLGFPMACLVNGDSASASEIVSACLQDHSRAVIIGERSYGKGDVQTVRDFEDGQLKFTIATFWRPNGKNLNKSSTTGKDEDEWGVTPDKGFLLKLSHKERDELFDRLRDSEIIPRRDRLPLNEVKPEFEDRQLEMAVMYLRRQIKAGPP